VKKLPREASKAAFQRSGKAKKLLTAAPRPLYTRTHQQLTSGLRHRIEAETKLEHQMSNYSTAHVLHNRESTRTAPGRLSWAIALVVLPLGLLALAGCETQNSAKTFKSESVAISNAMESVSTSLTNNTDTLVLHEGDTLSVTFAGAPDLNTVAAIRRDGRITLKSLGEFKAAGLTPPEMEKELIKLYGAQLQTKEVTVAVQSSAFPVYVTGAILRPGKILSDRPITALEAIMEAGGFDYTKANMKSIRVLRTENGRTHHYTINLKGVLKGNESEQFNLKPADIIYVPEKFTLF
jgi:polysaccharide export outer membrane protein